MERQLDTVEGAQHQGVKEAPWRRTQVWKMPPDWKLVTLSISLCPQNESYFFPSVSVDLVCRGPKEVSELHSQGS